MPLKRHEMGNVTVIELTGALDHAGMAAIKNTVHELIEEGRVGVVLDLHKVKGASMMHVGILVEEMRKLRRRGGDLKLVGMGGELCSIFDRLGTAEIFCRFSDVRNAVEDFGPGEGKN